MSNLPSRIKITLPTVRTRAGVEYESELTISFNQLADTLVPKAVKSIHRRARYMHGAIVVRLIGYRDYGHGGDYVDLRRKTEI